MYVYIIEQDTLDCEGRSIESRKLYYASSRDAASRLIAELDKKVDSWTNPAKLIGKEKVFE